MWGLLLVVVDSDGLRKLRLGLVTRIIKSIENGLGRSVTDHRNGSHVADLIRERATTDKGSADSNAGLPLSQRISGNGGGCNFAALTTSRKVADLANGTKNRRQDLHAARSQVARPSVKRVDFAANAKLIVVRELESGSVNL